MDERVVLHLDSMKRAATAAIALTEPLTYDDFVRDQNAQAATAMFLIIIGEAATKIGQLSPSFIEANQTVPWEKMRALRNRIVHEYETLHLPTVWSTAKESVPGLLAQIEALERAEGLGTSDPPHNAS